MRILLVDDHLATLEIMTRILHKLGHEVLAAASVREALALADAGAFDLMISDLTLPDGSGEDLMRAVGEKCRVPGIALSGYGRDEDIKRSQEAGFKMHLVKPLDFSSLQSALDSFAPPA